MISWRHGNGITAGSLSHGSVDNTELAISCRPSIVVLRKPTVER